MRFTKIVNDPARDTVRLPRLGKIRLGVKVKKGDKEYPKETDYFVCPPEVQAVYGPEPKELKVLFPTESEEHVFRQYYAVYGGNKSLLCQGNGQEAERLEFKKVGTDLVPVGRASVPCVGPETCPYSLEKGHGEPGCHRLFDLMVMLPDVSMGGVYQITTKSVTSDVDIRSALNMARKVVKRISWVPMLIRREEVLLADPVTHKMQKHWPVKLIFNMAFDEVREFRTNAEQLFLTESLEVEEPEETDEVGHATVVDTEFPTTAVSPPTAVTTSSEPEPVTAKATTSTTTTTTAGPNAVVSAAIRSQIVTEIKQAATPRALQSVGVNAKKMDEKLTTSDKEIIRTRYEQAKSDLQRIQQEELASAGKGTS